MWIENGGGEEFLLEEANELPVQSIRASAMSMLESLYATHPQFLSTLLFNLLLQQSASPLLLRPHSSASLSILSDAECDQLLHKECIYSVYTYIHTDTEKDASLTRRWFSLHLLV